MQRDVLKAMTLFRKSNVSKFMFTHESPWPDVIAFLEANPQVPSLDQMTNDYIKGEYATAGAFYKAVDVYINNWITWAHTREGVDPHFLIIVKATQRDFRKIWERHVHATTTEQLKEIRRLKMEFMHILDHPLDLRRDDQFLCVMKNVEEEIEGVDPGRYPDGTI